MLQRMSRMIRNHILFAEICKTKSPIISLQARECPSFRNYYMYLLSRCASLCSGEQDTAAKVMKVRARETVRMLLELVQDVSKPRVS